VADYTADGSLTQDIQDYVDAQTVTPKQVFKAYGMPDATNPVVEELVSGGLLSKFAVGDKTVFMEPCGIDTGVSHKFTMKCVSENDETGDECAFEISIRNRSDDPQGVGAYDTANASGDVALAADNDTEFDVSTTITNWDGVSAGDIMQIEVERVAIADGTEATGGIYLLGMILEPA